MKLLKINVSDCLKLRLPRRIKLRFAYHRQILGDRGPVVY